MIPLFLDTETYSDIPIAHGTYKYAENAEIIMWQYAIGDGEVIIPGAKSEVNNLINLLKNPEYEIIIHNSNFDRSVIKYSLGLALPLNRIFDTMVCAMAHSLPGGLEILCEILKIPLDKSKDKEGKKLINLFCKPQKDGSRATAITHPIEWAAFKKYGVLDIIAMREIYKILPKWNYKGFERELWALDQKINDRGFSVDLALAHSAIRACASFKKQKDEDTLINTGGAITTTNRRDKLLEYILTEYGVGLPDMTSATLERRITDENLPIELRQLLATRLQVSKTSVSKYKRVIDGASKDGRLRGTTKFNGAFRTGRWAGVLFQPQNLPRPTISNKEIELGIEMLKANAEEFL